MGITINQKYFLFVKLIHLSKFQLDLIQQNSLFEMIPKLFKYGYENAGRTKELLTGNQILGIADIGYFAEQGKNAGSARQELSRRKNNNTSNFLVSLLSKIIKRFK